MVSPAVAAAAFKEEYELSANQSLLLDIIYERKCVQKNEDIKLSHDEVALLGNISISCEAATRRCLAGTWCDLGSLIRITIESLFHEIS